MVRTPEHEQGRPIFPERTATRRRAVELQSSGPFRPYAKQFEGENKHPPTTQNNSDFPQADPERVYTVSGSVKINGYQLPEGVLPINATPISKINFLSRLFLRLGLIHQQK